MRGPWTVRGTRRSTCLKIGWMSREKSIGGCAARASPRAAGTACARRSTPPASRMQAEPIASHRFSRFIDLWRGILHPPSHFLLLTCFLRLTCFRTSSFRLHFSTSDLRLSWGLRLRNRHVAAPSLQETSCFLLERSLLASQFCQCAHLPSSSVSRCTACPARSRLRLSCAPFPTPRGSPRRLPSSRIRRTRPINTWPSSEG